MEGCGWICLLALKMSKRNSMRRAYSRNCAETILLLMKSGGLKWEGWVGRSGRKDKNTIITLLGRFYTTFVAVGLITNILLKEANMSEFSACPPGDRYGSGKRGKFKRCLYVCRETQNPKLLAAAMVTTFIIEWKYEIQITFPLLLTYLLFLYHLSSRSDLPVSTSAQMLYSLCIFLRPCPPA